jgi:hypothetical protein
LCDSHFVFLVNDDFPTTGFSVNIDGQYVQLKMKAMSANSAERAKECFKPADGLDAHADA